MAEIFRKVETEHPSQPHRHIRISGKIKINLHPEGENPQPGHEHRPIRLRHALDLRPQLPHGVCQKHLLCQPHKENPHSRFKFPKALPPSL